MPLFIKKYLTDVGQLFRSLHVIAELPSNKIRYSKKIYIFFNPFSNLSLILYLSHPDCALAFLIAISVIFEC